jgi:hypothetical protein
MNKEKILRLRAAAEARYGEVIRMGSPTLGNPGGSLLAAPGSVSRPRWADGTPKRKRPDGTWEADRIAQLREVLDVERINSRDARYVAAHASEIQELMDLERADRRDSPPPPPEVPEGTPQVIADAAASQTKYEETRGAVMATENAGQIKDRIAELEARLGVFKDDAE